MHFVAPCTRRSLALLLGGLLLVGCSRSDKSASSTSSSTAASASGAPSAAAAPSSVPASAAAVNGEGRRRGLRHKPANLLMRAGQPCPPVTNDRIWRFIEGLDECPRVLAEGEIAQELKDAWAAKVLRAGTFPTSVAEIVAAMASKVPEMASGQKSYVVGEGSQVQLSVAPRDGGRDLRYVVTWGEGQSAAIFLSALPGGGSSFLQIIAWDAAKSSFNFYEYSTARPGWIWTGDSSYALRDEARGHGCFDCHHNGTLIMKELATPWNNWHSTQAPIDPRVVPEAVANEALFQNREPASGLEGSVRDGFEGYHNARLKKLIQRKNDGSHQISGMPELLSHVISSSTINLASTQIVSDPTRATAPQAPVNGLPSDFLLRDSVLQDVVSLGYTFPELNIKRADYDAYMKTQEYRLVHDDEKSPRYEAPGSTYFAFFVPVPSAEDTYIIKVLRNDHLVSDKFIAAVQMVDFANPVFSTVRDALLKYAEQLPSSTLARDQNDIPQRFAALVDRGAQGQPPCETSRLERCTAEQQFLFFWNIPDALNPHDPKKPEPWKKEMSGRLQAYLDVVGKRLGTPQGLDDYMRLALSRHEQLKQWPVLHNLFEFSLLFPRTTPLIRMNVDGTVDPI